MVEKLGSDNKIDLIYLWILSLLVIASGIAFSFLGNLSGDVTIYLQETATMAKCIQNGEWFGNYLVGTHGFIFKIPAAALLAVFGRSLWIPISVNIIYAFIAAVLTYKLSKKYLKSAHWAFGVTLLTISSYHFVLHVSNYLRDLPAMLMVLLIIYAIINNKSKWVLGLLLMLLLDAKEMVFFAVMPGILIYYFCLYWQQTYRNVFERVWKSCLKMMGATMALCSPAIIFLFLMFFTMLVPVNRYDSKLLGLEENSKLFETVFRYLGKNIDKHKGGAKIGLKELRYNEDGKIEKSHPMGKFDNMGVSIWCYFDSDLDNSIESLFSICSWYQSLFRVYRSLDNICFAVKPPYFEDKKGLQAKKFKIVQSNQWMHVFAYCDSRSNAYLFVNGEGVISTKTTGNIGTWVGGRSDKFINIGAFSQYGVYLNPFQGYIDECYWWNNLKFSDETDISSFVEDLYNKGTGRFINFDAESKNWQFDDPKLDQHNKSLYGAYFFDEEEGSRYDVIDNRFFYDINKVASSTNAMRGLSANFREGQFSYFSAEPCATTTEEYAKTVTIKSRYKKSVIVPKPKPKTLPTSEVKKTAPKPAKKPVVKPVTKPKPVVRPVTKRAPLPAEETLVKIVKPPKKLIDQSVPVISVQTETILPETYTPIIKTYSVNRASFAPLMLTKYMGYPQKYIAKGIDLIGSLVSMTVSPEMELESKSKDRAVKFRIAYAKLLQFLLGFINFIARNGCKIFFYRTLSFLSIPRFVAIPAIIMAIFSIKKRSLMGAILISYVIIFLLRMNYGRYLFPVSPIFFLFFVDYIRFGLKNKKTGLIIYFITLATILIGFTFEKQYLIIKIIYNVILCLFLISIFILSWKKKPIVKILLPIFIGLLALLMSGTAIMSSYKLNQLKRWKAYGSHFLSAQLKDYIPENSRVIINGNCWDSAIPEFYLGEIDPYTLELTPNVYKAYCLEKADQTVYGSNCNTLSQLISAIKGDNIQYIVLGISKLDEDNSKDYFIGKSSALEKRKKIVEKSGLCQEIGHIEGQNLDVYIYQVKE